MQYFCTDAPRWRRARRSSKSWVTRSNAKGRSDLQAAKTLIPRQQSCSRYATSDWCGLPAASSFLRHWRRCSDGQSGEYVRRRLDADGCRDQYHKRKPLQVTFSAVHRISCCNPSPSQLTFILLGSKPGFELLTRTRGTGLPAQLRKETGLASRSLGCGRLIRGNAWPSAPCNRRPAFRISEAPGSGMHAATGDEPHRKCLAECCMRLRHSRTQVILR